jgi:chorismate mutase
MGNIEQFRKQIDDIDEQILKALSERVRVCKAIGDAKRKQGLAVRDSFRENEIYKRIKAKSVEFGLNSREVEAVYREIVNMCSAVQE